MSGCKGVNPEFEKGGGADHGDLHVRLDIVSTMILHGAFMVGTQNALMCSKLWGI